MYAQTLWKRVYEDPQVLKDYHREVSADPAAEVGLWQDGMRTVSFCTPLQAPALIKKTIGASLNVLLCVRVGTWFYIVVSGSGSA